MKKKIFENGDDQEVVDDDNEDNQNNIGDNQEENNDDVPCEDKTVSTGLGIGNNKFWHKTWKKKKR